MKFQVTFKDPDGPSDCLTEEAEKSVAELKGIDDAERSALADLRREQMQEFAGKFLSYGEYVCIEFDTEAGTAVVVPKG